VSRGRFVVKDNPLKSYRQRYPNERLRQWAEEKRAGQLGREGQRIWPGEIAFKRILDNLKVYYACQFIIYRTGSFILLDFFVPSRKVAFELDGTTHAQQREYDAGRDKWLLETQGIRTIRISNLTALRNSKACEAIIRAELRL
jgi:very-short-patch-repair endonuclease